MWWGEDGIGGIGKNLGARIVQGITIDDRVFQEAWFPENVCLCNRSVEAKETGFSLGECYLLPETSIHQQELDCIVAKDQVSELFSERLRTNLDLIWFYSFSNVSMI